MILSAEQADAIKEAICVAVDKATVREMERCYVRLDHRKGQLRDRIFIVMIPRSFKQPDIMTYVSAQRMEPIGEMLRSGEWHVSLTGGIKDGDCIEVGR